MHHFRKIGIAFLLVFISGFFLDGEIGMPVEGADAKSYHPKSFWYYPWGKSVTHKGIDIFAKEGTNVRSSTDGILLYTGNIERGGNVAIILGPKWRIHYYAHLQEFSASNGFFVARGQKIGTVGTSGNAKGKQPHLHYSVSTIIPYPWRMDSSVQGWKKMFYLNPVSLLSE